ncbi:MAG: hypothetical protein ABI162_10175 [Luteolibacter sp.]
MADETADSVKKRSFGTWYLWLDRATLATDGDLLMPFGDYGAERLSP